jgi:FkbM family methyltransferase
MSGVPESARDRPLAEILGVDIVVDIVDIGASPIDGQPVYERLLSRGQARVVGFEPDPAALRALERTKGAAETYLPYAIGDGQAHTLHLCQAPGMSSLLRPNQTLLANYHGFPEWGVVRGTRPVQTVRLDDVREIAAMDFLKIDIQGAELMALRNAPRQLSRCGVVQAEVEFLPMYEGQPLFADIELYLRGLGFAFHKFSSTASPALKPMQVGNSPAGGLSQMLFADAVFVRDFTRLGLLTAATLIKTAAVLHDIYRSYDLVLRFLMEHDRRAGTGYAGAYGKNLVG